MCQKILNLIDRWSQQIPDQLAVVDPDGKSLSYLELMDQAKRFAFFLQSKNLHHTGYIGIFLSQCYELPIALLAVWMVGAAYVPVDPIYPQQRALEIFKKVNISSILTTPTYSSPIFEQQAATPCIEITEECFMSKQYPKISNSIKSQHDLAYVIFTSGSTGKPKGVKISESSLLNFLSTFVNRLTVSRKDRLLSVTPIAFDIFGLELFLPLICGGTCYFTSRSMALDAASLLDQMKQNQITLFQATPATYYLLAEEDWPDLTLRHILCGGESWDQKLASSLLEKMPPSCSLWNVYGPTETTIWSSLYHVQHSDQIYLTSSIEQTFFYVLDENLCPAKEGELYIAGAGVAKGYYQEEELSRQQFLPNPFHREFDVMYKTGDIVRSIDNKTWQFLGRSDMQVKIRGFRVELGDIENALLQHPSIARAVVLYDYLKYTDERSLIACIQITENSSLENYRQFLSSLLPSYMIPEQFIPLSTFPLNCNGKIDRRGVFAMLKDHT